MQHKLEQLIQAHHIILFDAQCVLCSAWANFMIKNDHHHQFRLASVQSSLGQQLLRKYQLPTDHFETMVLLEKGQLYTESTAFLRIIQRLDNPYALLRYAGVIPKAIRDFAYRRIALNRYRLFGKTDHCYMVTPEVQQHFLLDDVLQ
ncbi:MULTISPECIES: thiol-disulfide oxidoreductase DCC family protein [unclassified Acinetobacter]|uniref:thiol-disulfide oxidoreductase DCC family protein n=1 Tax=unclassified Acinetobacter TaxID=196816 RepID=UPI002449F931|nr:MULTISPECIES: thiol-disulfide oxidoreductase DCC family protein [unclassified Acinetobacter]MDH0031116.1 thiol-disulfide oxidoreductase DCC family protein [Acinetobacter sp. GD04021]MDH0886702.1 thiol-disulfide oxidoreductase DCC family protein [Acinetobacter sp. GD03873]MDH1083165.1 thiol-disulfide oxidoreductase DCC family protein [Acinetobacter sp. GD03983]MDH2189322.1 thiol-disulfide oxidoreductase DCC family protein [Acinetobacter sp. GD03645]MDH2202871.1 thiol-disulfide oxidoreductase